jgi:glucan phosphoethanolaminetransferase (alkaline phosphatase superfamily)
MVVGKAFLYIAIAVSTALFPQVSRRTETREESSLELLNLSLVYCLLLCVLGIAACILFPVLIRDLLFPRGSLITVQLIKIFGFGMTPVALLYILINYLLARGRSAFLFLLVPMALAYVSALQVWHSRLSTIIWVMAGFGLVTFLGLYLVILRSETSLAPRRPLSRPERKI